MAEIFVSNIPWASTEADLTSLLESWFGGNSIISCEIKRDDMEGQHKGYGFVRFLDQDKVGILLALTSEPDHEFVLQNRALRFGLSNGRSNSKSQDSGVQVQAGKLYLGCLEKTFLHQMWVSDFNVSLDFDTKNRKFSILVEVWSASGVRQFKLEFLLKFIYRIHMVKLLKQGTPNALLLELWNPPRIYKKMEDIDIWQQEDPGLSELTDVLLHIFNSSSSQDRSWIRTVDFTPFQSIGHSLWYVVEFQEIPKDDILGHLKDFNIIPARPLRIELILAENLSSSQILAPILNAQHGKKLSFEIMFKLNHLVQVGSLKAPTLNRMFYDLLSETPREQALWVLQQLSESDRMIDDPGEWFKNELKKNQFQGLQLSSSMLNSLEEGLVWVNRIVVTPTKVYCMGPEVEISNRVIRQYMHLIENFVRVSFVDEDWENLPSASLSLSSSNRVSAGFQVGHSDIHDRILKVLKEGISLEGKKYEFLAFSSSQLKDQSVWMFAPCYPVTAATIRLWMGDFLGIRNVAKCAARMGQCFSSSTKTLAVYPNEVEQISDVEVVTDGTRYCFSDGIGQISGPFAETIAARCGCKKMMYGRLPSAFQIRYGGYKGVVAVNPRSRYKLSLRPSMRKFDSNHYYLEVIGWTRPVACFLNRQIISLLSTLGIQDKVFEQLQWQMISRLDQLLKDREGAIEILQAAYTGGTHLVTLEMLNAGYHPSSEPYLTGLLKSFRNSQLKRLWTKARILVPKGRCLMGCLDETSSLNYGEIFLQVSSYHGRSITIDDGLEMFVHPSHQSGKDACVVTGLVVVAKNPCVHPGDVRVLRAVDVLELQHMVDCIVFPQRGHRPHPNECSGSDLDGDLYFVSWDQVLVPPTIDPPMNYTPAKQTELDRPVTIEDIEEFFVKHTLSDSLGVIANAHTVHADKELGMARDPKCIELSRLFSVAVDFSKTGVPAVIPPGLRPSKYPDFMGKEQKVSYKSDRILGKLYRSISGESQMASQEISFTREDIANSFDEDLIFGGNGFHTYLEEAWQLKQWYDMKLHTLMMQYSIKTEAEALSGNLIALGKYFAKRQGEVKERIRLAVRSLQNETRTWFRSGYQGSEGYSLDDSIELTQVEKFAKASAWYYVTYHRDYVLHRKGPNNVGHDTLLLSFPWTVYDTLLTIKGLSKFRG